MILHEVHRWAGVALVLLAAEEGEAVEGDRAVLAFAFDVAPSRDIWAADAVLRNWRHRLNERYWRCATAGEARRAHADNLRAWVATTRGIAEDLRRVYGDSLATRLDQAADEAEQTIGWIEAHVESTPQDPQARANLLLAADLWAFDRVRDVLMNGRRTLEGVPGRDAGRTKLLQPALEALQDAGLPAATSDLTLRSRVNRLRVRPGQEDALVADVLSACRTGGPYDRDGRLQ